MGETGDLRLTIEAARRSCYWLMRCYGYELARVFFCITEPSCYEMNYYRDFIPEFLREKNDRCLKSSLSAVKVFIRRCVFDTPLAQNVTRIIIRNIFSKSSSRVQDLSSQILLDFIELGRCDMVLRELISGALRCDSMTRNCCLRTMRYALSDFGPKVVSVTRLLRFVEYLVKKLLFEEVEEECSKLLLTMYRYIGPHIRVHLVPLLRPDLLSSIEDRYERARDLNMCFHRYVRCVKGNSETLSATEEKCFAMCKIVREEHAVPQDYEGVISDGEDAIDLETWELDAELNGEICMECGVMNNFYSIRYDSNLPFQHANSLETKNDQKYAISYDLNDNSKLSWWGFAYRPLYLFVNGSSESGREEGSVSSDFSDEPNESIAGEDSEGQPGGYPCPTVDQPGSNESHLVPVEISQRSTTNNVQKEVKKLEPGVAQTENTRQGVKRFMSDTSINLYRCKDNIQNVRHYRKSLCVSCLEIRCEYKYVPSPLSDEEKKSLKNLLVHKDTPKRRVVKQVIDLGKLHDISSNKELGRGTQKGQFKSKVRNWFRRNLEKLRFRSFSGTKNVKQTHKKKGIWRCFRKPKKCHSDSAFVKCSDFNFIQPKNFSLLNKYVENKELSDQDLERCAYTANTNNNADLVHSVSHREFFESVDSTEFESLDGELLGRVSEVYEVSSGVTTSQSDGVRISEISPSLCCNYFQRNSINRLKSKSCDAGIHSLSAVEDEGYTATDGKRKVTLDEPKTSPYPRGISRLHGITTCNCGSGDEPSSSSSHCKKQELGVLHPQDCEGKRQSLFCCISMGDLNKVGYHF